MPAFAGQIRGNYVLAFHPYAETPAFADVLTNPPFDLQDGDVVVIVNAADPTAPVIAAHGVYSHPAPVINSISGPQ